VGAVWWKKYSPRRLMRCRRCDHMRRAGRLRVRVYYDTMHVFCADREHCYAARAGVRR